MALKFYNYFIIPNISKSCKSVVRQVNITTRILLIEKKGLRVTEQPSQAAHTGQRWGSLMRSPSPLTGSAGTALSGFSGWYARSHTSGDRAIHTSSQSRQWLVNGADVLWFGRISSWKAASSLASPATHHLSLSLFVWIELVSSSEIVWSSLKSRNRDAETSENSVRIIKARQC